MMNTISYWAPPAPSAVRLWMWRSSWACGWRTDRQFNVERMEAQCRKFRPRLAVMTEEAAAKELAVRLQDTSVKVLAGTDALVDAAVIPEVETVVTAVVGMVGLKATLAAIREKKRIALANKETLVCAGELVMGRGGPLRCGDRAGGQ